MESETVTKSNLPKSVRKFIRQEKARIRANFLLPEKQKEMVNQLYKDVLKKDKPAESNKSTKSEKVAKTTKSTKNVKERIKEGNKK